MKNSKTVWIGAAIGAVVFSSAWLYYYFNLADPAKYTGSDGSIQVLVFTPMFMIGGAIVGVMVGSLVDAARGN